MLSVYSHYGEQINTRVSLDYELQYLDIVCFMGYELSLEGLGDITVTKRCTFEIDRKNTEDH